MYITEIIIPVFSSLYDFQFSFIHLQMASIFFFNTSLAFICFPMDRDTKKAAVHDVM